MRKHHGDELWLAALNGNGCRGKVRHPSKRHAKAAGRLTPVRYRGFVLNVYRCRTCCHWHLGNSPRRFITDDTSIAPDAHATALEHALADALRPYLAPAATA